MPKSVNPFRPSAGVEPPYLAGRADVIREFSRMLRDVRSGSPQNMMIWGLRGVGKTVLLSRLEKTNCEEEFIPVTNLLFDPTYSDPKVFINSLQERIESAVKSPIMTGIKKSAKKIGKQARPSEVGIAGISYKPAYGADSGELPTDRMIDYLAKVYKPAAESGMGGIVFLFDEFHTVRNIKDRGWDALGGFIGAIYKLQMDGCKYSVVLSGLPPMRRHVRDARSFSERMFGYSAEIGNLEECDARKAILEPLKSTDWSFSDDLVSAITSDSGKYPYFIQFLAKETIDLADKRRIGLEDYSEFRDLIIKKLNRSFFDPRMETLTDGQTRVLYAMASVQKGEIDLAAICSKTDIRKGTVYNHLKFLAEKNMVYKSKRRGSYRFSMPLFKSYLLNQKNSA